MKLVAFFVMLSAWIAYVLVFSTSYQVPLYPKGQGEAFYGLPTYVTQEIIDGNYQKVVVHPLNIAGMYLFSSIVGGLLTCIWLKRKMV